MITIITNTTLILLVNDESHLRLLLYTLAFSGYENAVHICVHNTVN